RPAARPRTSGNTVAGPSRNARRRFTQKVNQVQEQPTVITPSAQFLGAAMPLVPGNIYGRMGKGAVSGRRLVNAPVTGPAAGNWRVTSDARGQRAAQPAKGA